MEKKAYLAWDDNDIKSSNDEEGNICLMEDHPNDEVSSYFYY